MILTSFGLRRAGPEDDAVVDAIVEEDIGSLQDASLESFADYERAIHVVVGERQDGRVVRRICDYLNKTSLACTSL